MNIIYQEFGLMQAFLSKSPETGIKFLNWLIDQMRSKPSIKVSIEFLANLFKVDPRTIQRWLKKFAEWKLIKKQQLYGPYCHNTITLNRAIFKYARYLKYQLTSLWDYLDFVYLRPIKSVGVTPYIEEKDINISIGSQEGSISHPVHPNLFINSCDRSTTSSSLWGIGYQEFVFNGNGKFERSIPDDRQLENFKKILEEVEMNADKVNKEDLFWDGLAKVLNLSAHGLIKLKVFPAAVVNACYKRLQRQIKVHDKVKWLIRECDSQCKDEGRNVLWAKYYDGLRSLGIDQNSSLVEEEQIDLLDFSRPTTKEIQVYSVRDLSAHKKEIDAKTLERGLLFLGDFLSNDVKESVKNYIKSLPVESNV